jgi:hypothetical protein
VAGPDADTLPPLDRPSGGALRPGSWSYRLTLQRDGTSTPLGVRIVEVTDTQLAGSPAWLIAERRTGTAVPTSDSLWLSRTDLTPLRWLATIGKTQLAASFTHDSVFGALQSYRGRSSFVSPLPPDALVTAGQVERIVEALPLTTGYAVSASMLLLDRGTPRVLPAALGVAGEVRITVMGRDEDCWLVTLHTGPMSERLWVTKRDRRVVRTEQPTESGVLVAE